MSNLRLDRGGQIDRSRPLRFYWRGRLLQGYAGDTLASAMLANNISLVGRSFKYHRPRGLMSAGVEESGALVTLGQGAGLDANIRPSSTELFDGLQARAQNAWPSLGFDMGAINNYISQFLPAGFYYKTFMGPMRDTRTWMFFEKFIRRAAGMGTASREHDPDQYEVGHAHCDLLVVGSGPAGLAAARTAAEKGLRVLVAEQDFEIGGDCLRGAGEIEGMVLREWRDHQLIALEKTGNAAVLSRTTVFGLYDDNVAGLIERTDPALLAEDPQLPRERSWVLRCRNILLATGAIERMFAFANNDRPGVFQAGAIQTYINRFAVIPGQRAVISTNNDSAYEVALSVSRCLDITLVDSRQHPPENLTNRVREAGIPFLSGEAALSVRGRWRASSLRLGRRRGSKWVASSLLKCDLIGVSGGWSPTIHLACHRGLRPRYDEDLAAFVVEELPANLAICGSAAGIWGRQECIESGRQSAEAIAQQLSPQGSSSSRALARQEAATDSSGSTEMAIEPLWEVDGGPGKFLSGDAGKKFIDWQHDVTADDIRIAAREGYIASEHLKRYTTLGMAPDQGKTSNLLGLGIMAETLGVFVADVGVTTFRPPYTAVSIGALSGRACGLHWQLRRLVPAHEWHRQRGSIVTEAGLWMRPWFYPQGLESFENAYKREMRSVHQRVGLVDVSTLGKIAVQGPDAGEFLDRVYVNNLSQLPVGRARYGVMLRDDGFVFDDGTCWRLAEDDFFMTTTTANAGPVLAWLEMLLDTRWNGLKVRLTSVTDQWCGYAVAGPRSRAVLLAVLDDINLARKSFPLMAVQEGHASNIPCRIARLSFSGELAYEVFAAADYGAELLGLLADAVTDERGGLYGTEALGALRIEKGHVAGPELDGRTTLADLGLEKMASKKKSFVGQSLGQRPEMVAADRRRLVGLIPLNNTEALAGGALLFADENSVHGHGIGWVSSVTWSDSIDNRFALAFVEGGMEAWGGKTLVVDDAIRGGRCHAQVVPSCLFDPQGERLHG